MDRGAGKPIVAAKNVGDLHGQVVGHGGQVIGREAVRFEEGGVVNRIGVPGNVFAVNKVVIRNLQVVGDLEFDGPVSQMVVPTGISEDGGIPLGLGIFGRTITVKSMAGSDQFFGRLLVNPLGVPIRLQVKFVPRKPKFVQSVLQGPGGSGDFPFLIRIFDPQDETAAAGSSQSVSVEGGAQGANVQEAGGRGSEAGADHVVKFYHY